MKLHPVINADKTKLKRREGDFLMDMKMGLRALKSFYIMQILLERTDEAHSLNATQIRDILENVYGVKIDRHTLYMEIEKLSNAGLDIIKYLERLLIKYRKKEPDM